MNVKIRILKLICVQTLIKSIDKMCHSRIPEANKEKSKLWYSPAAPTMPNIFIFLLIVSWVGFSMCQSFSNASTTTPEQILSKNGTITGELSKTSTTKPNEPSTSPIRTSEKPIDPEDEAAKILLQNITSNAELTGVRESKKGNSALIASINVKTKIILASTTPSTPTSTQSTLEEDDVLIKLLKAPQRPTVRRGWHRPWRPNSYFEYKTDWNNSVQVLVTKESWESYSRFKGMILQLITVSYSIEHFRGNMQGSQRYIYR